MDVETSDLPTTKNSTEEHSDYQDYPRKTDKLSENEYQDKVKEFFKLKGFNHNNDFSDEQKNTLVEDNTIRLIGPMVLCQEYNTMIHVVKYFIRDSGFIVVPDDFSKYPDIPEKTDDISNEDYQVLW